MRALGPSGDALTSSHTDAQQEPGPKAGARSGDDARSTGRCGTSSLQFMLVTFEPERLRDAIGSHRCSFGMPAVMATTDGEGRIKPTSINRLKTKHGDQRWAELFSSAGVPSAFEPEMALWLRC